jgi:hypothetical protein
MGHQSVWRTGPDGVLAAEAGGLRLVVHSPCRVSGAVRFLILRVDGEHHSIIGSGTEESVRGAMDAAGRMAKRLLAHPFGTTPRGQA